MEGWQVHTDKGVSSEQSEQEALAQADREHLFSMHVLSVNNPDGSVAYTRKQLEVRFAELKR